MIQEHRDQTPKGTKNINSMNKIVTSLGIFSNQKLEDNKLSHSTNSIQQHIKLNKIEGNQNQEQAKYPHSYKSVKFFAQNDHEKNLNQHIVEQFQIQSNNPPTTKELVIKKQSASNQELDNLQNDYYIYGKTKANNVENSNNIQDPKQRQYQILINKNKSNIIYLQSQIKQILKLNLLIQCVYQQKQIKNTLNKMELQIRKIKTQLSDKKKEDYQTKQRMKKLQQLRLMCNQQKIISNQLNIRQIETEQLLSKHRIYMDSISILLDQKQRSKQRKKQNQKYKQIVKSKQKQKTYLYYQGQLDSVNKSSIKQDSMQMIQSYHYGQITQVDSQSQTYSDKFKSRNTNKNYKQKPSQVNIISSDRIPTQIDRANKQKGTKNSRTKLLRLTNNSQGTSNACNSSKVQEMSQISQIIQSSHGLKHINYRSNQDAIVDIKEKDENYCHNGSYNYKMNNTGNNTNNNTCVMAGMIKNEHQYKKLLHQRINIVRQSLKFIQKENSKREHFLIQQKMCIKKNIQLFKLDILKIQQQNRRLNKLHFRKKLSSLSKSFQSSFQSNHFKYKLLKSNEKSRRSIITNSLKKNKHHSYRYRLKINTDSSQDNNDMQPRSKLLYWNSYKQYQISTDRTLSGSSKKNLPTNKYILNKPQPKLSPNISQYRNSNIYTSRNIHALSYRNFNFLERQQGGHYSVDQQETPDMKNKMDKKIFASSLHDEYYN